MALKALIKNGYQFILDSGVYNDVAKLHGSLITEKLKEVVNQFHYQTDIVLPDGVKRLNSIFEIEDAKKKWKETLKTGIYIYLYVFSNLDADEDDDPCILGVTIFCTWR